MAAINNNLVGLFPLQEAILDKDTGEPLSGGVVTFYKDSDHTVLKPVYQQVQSPQGNYTYVQLNNPITLSSIGSFTDNSGNDIIPYLFPFSGTITAPTGVELYYITVYAAQPPLASGVLQFTRDSWPPGLTESTTPTELFQESQNAIANPQFVEVLFAPLSGYTITGLSSPGQITQIAPSWFIKTTGTGTVIVKQIAVTDQNAVSNPPFALDIECTGITTLNLVQRLSQSPRIFGGDYVSTSVVTNSLNGVNTITVSYVPSDGSASTTLLSEDTAASGFTQLVSSPSILLPRNNTQSGEVGYVDIVINIPVSAHIQITSVQIVNVQNSTSIIPFMPLSTARQLDQLSHYYVPKLEYKPIPSHLTAWDFPLNPAQEFTSTFSSTGAALLSYYIWDQTIMFQTAAAGFSVSRNSITGGLQLIRSADSSGAIIQYVDQARAREILSQRMSVEIKGLCGASTLTGTVSMYWTSGASLPDISTGKSLVSSIVAGSPVVGGGGAHGSWTTVARGGLNAKPSFTLTSATTSFGFSGWEDTSGASSATYFAIVVAFDTVNLAIGSLTIDYVSLVSGDVHTRPAPQTPDEVLRECQYYYETTYPIAASPLGSSAGATSNNTIYAKQTVDKRNVLGIPSDSLYASSFAYQYKTIKRVTPSLSFYSGSSTTANKVQGFVYQSGILATTGELTLSSGWSSYLSSTKGFVYQSIGDNIYLSSTTGITTSPEAFLLFHVIANARLGNP